MSEEPERIRLPELPVFKRFSLALRQEFAPAEEVLAILERSKLKVSVILQAASTNELPEEEGARAAPRGEPLPRDRKRSAKRKRPAPKKPSIVLLSRRGKPVTKRSRPKSPKAKAKPARKRKK